MASDTRQVPFCVNVGLLGTSVASEFHGSGTRPDGRVGLQSSLQGCHKAHFLKVDKGIKELGSMVCIQTPRLLILHT